MTPNTLKNEHLAPGVRPIMVGLCESDCLTADTRQQVETIAAQAVFVDYCGDADFFRANNILHPGADGYAISGCTPQKKYSVDYCYCVGAALVGSDKTTGQTNSILSHQAPLAILQFCKEIFAIHFRERIQRLLEKSQSGTVDAVLFGGKDGPSHSYAEAIYLLDRMITSELGFSPAVLTGPSLTTEQGMTAVYLETQERRIHLLRPRQLNHFTNASYAPQDILRQVVLWGGEMHQELSRMQNSKAKNSPFAFRLPTREEALASFYS